MGWKNLGEKPVVHTPWFRLNLAEVELPGGLQVVSGQDARRRATQAGPGERPAGDG
jgi:hypothetical protein